MSPVVFVLLFVAAAQCAPSFSTGRQHQQPKFVNRPPPPTPSWRNHRFRRAIEESELTPVEIVENDERFRRAVEESELTPVKIVESDERFRRSTIDEEKLVSDDEKEVEIVTDEQMIKSVQEQQLPEGEYEEIPTATEIGRRAKRATVTIIRVRNRRTGKVTYIIIRRR